MRSFIAAGAIALLASGCTGTVNREINTLQFNGETEPYPSDYRARAQLLAARYDPAPGALIEISEPRTMVGATAFDPQRWYICIRGFAEMARIGVQPPSPDTGNLLDLVGELFSPSPTRDAYQIVVVFRTDQFPFLIGAVDSRLCRDGAYSRLDV